MTAIGLTRNDAERTAHGGSHRAPTPWHAARPTHDGAEPTIHHDSHQAPMIRLRPATATRIATDRAAVPMSPGALGWSWARSALAAGWPPERGSSYRRRRAGCVRRAGRTGAAVPNSAEALRGWSWAGELPWRRDGRPSAARRVGGAERVASEVAA